MLWYLVTAVEEKEVTLQKFTKDQFRKKEYRVKKSDLIITPQGRSKGAGVNNKLSNVEVKRREKDEYFVPMKQTQSRNCPTYASEESDSTGDSDDDDLMLFNKLHLFLPNQKRRYTDEVIVDEHQSPSEQELDDPHTSTGADDRDGSDVLQDEDQQDSSEEEVVDDLDTARADESDGSGGFQDDEEK